MKIIAGIIGLGIGEKHLEAIESLNKNCFVKVLCEKNKKKISYLKKKYPNKIITSNENFIFKDKEINLVSICSYDNYHYGQITKSIKSKKHFIIEKPFCLDEKELKHLHVLLKKNRQIKFTSNMVLRVNSLFLKIKQILQKETIFYIEADYIWGRSHKLFEWRSKIRKYSLIHGAAIHMIDLICWMIGKKPTHVQSFANSIATRNSKFKKDSLVLIVLRFSNGLLVKITANGAAKFNHFHELRIFSKKKTILNYALGSYYFENGKMNKLKGDYPDKKNRKKLIQSFLQSIIASKKSKISYTQNLFDVMSICFAAEKSLNIKRQIKIKYL